MAAPKNTTQPNDAYGAYYDYDPAETNAAAVQALQAGRGPIDASITFIIAREIIEAIMFITTHIGAVMKHPSLSKEERSHYLWRLIPALLAGFTSGLIVTLAVIIPLSTEVNRLQGVSAGIEIGEGVSRGIAAFFVADLALKLPKWFGFSNFKKKKKATATGTTTGTTTTTTTAGALPDKTVTPPAEETSSDDAEAGKSATLASDDDSDIHDLASANEMAFSLWWNTFRESCEGGLLAGITAIFSFSTSLQVGASVGLGFAIAIALGIVFGIGAKFISPLGFGLAATGIAMILAVGLTTGAVRAFEEAYSLDHGGVTSAVVYQTSGTTMYALGALEFMGWKGSQTVATLVTWILALLLMVALELRHNYFGYPILPPPVKRVVCCPCLVIKHGCKFGCRAGKRYLDKRKQAKLAAPTSFASSSTKPPKPVEAGVDGEANNSSANAAAAATNATPTAPTSVAVA